MTQVFFVFFFLSFLSFLFTYQHKKKASSCLATVVMVININTDNAAELDSMLSEMQELVIDCKII
jgi:hypothetical protein